MDFFVKGDLGSNFKIGNSANKIYRFPISNLIRVDSIDVIDAYGSVTINSQSQKDITFTVTTKTIDDCVYIPIAIVGYDISAAYYCAFQKMFLSGISGTLNKQANIRIANNSSSNYTSNRFYIMVLYVQYTCPWISS